jgi:hypothetical protein
MSERAGTEVGWRRKVLRRFYEPLLLLNALGQVRGERLKPELNIEINASNHQKTRRAFADGIAYICAYTRGPDSVTATALESSPQGVILWLAANASIKPEVTIFLRGILNALASIAEQNDAIERRRLGEQIRESLLTRTITFNSARLLSYHHLVKGFIKECLPRIQQAGQLTRKSTDTQSYTTHMLSTCLLWHARSELSSCGTGGTLRA